MIPILDWIFEGIVGWVASIVSQLMDAVSGLFLEALGTDMTAMEEYFPFVTKAYDVMQITAWAILILIVVWQLFRAFGGPITEAENPWHLVVRGALFALLIGYAKPIFTICLSIARAPYTSLMDLTMTAEDFTFAGIEQALTNGLTTLVSVASVVGLILILILEIALGWNYFKLLLETVERYIVVGVLCYTSPLAFSMGGSKATNTVFRSWCRMVGSQLLLLVMNVWFLRGFSSTMGQFIANGGALSTGKGSIFLWMFCALAYLKCAQRFDSYLASIGLNVAQTGSSMGMELLMAARVVSGIGSGARSAGNVFGRGGSAASGAVATGTGAAANGFAAGFASRFSPNSYVRDAVVEGGNRMGFGGGAGFFGRAFGGIAARNGATLNSNSISSVANRNPNGSGTIAGDIADRSLSNYMPQMQGFQLQGTQITGGHISTTAISPDGKQSAVDMFHAGQYEKPDAPHSVVTAADGSQWYQMASGEGRGAFYDAPVFNGMGTETPGAATDSSGVPGNADTANAFEGVNPVGDGQSSGGSHEFGDGFAPGNMEYPGAHGDSSNGSGYIPDGSEMPLGATGEIPNIGASPVEEAAVGGVVLSEATEGMSINTVPAEISSDESSVGGDIVGGDGVVPQFGAMPGEVPSDTAPLDGGYGSANVDPPQTVSGAEGGVSAALVAETSEAVVQPAEAGIHYGREMPGEPAAETPQFGGVFVGGGDGQSQPEFAAGAGESYEGGYHGGHGEPQDGGYSGYHSAYSEAPLVAATFPSAPEGTALRTVDDGVIEASAPDGGNTLWYNSAYFQEPDAPHSVIQSANGVDWYTMQQQADAPHFELGEAASAYNQATFQNFMPGYDRSVSQVDGSHRQDGHFEVRHADGSGTAFYDTARYATPRGDYQVFEDARGSQWYAIRGEAAVERKPVYENGKPVYDGENVKTVNVETVRYKQTPTRFSSPEKRADIERKTPRRKL